MACNVLRGRMRRWHLMYLLAGFCGLYFICSVWIMYLLGNDRTMVTNLMSFIHKTTNDSPCDDVDLSRLSIVYTNDGIGGQWQPLFSDTCPAEDASVDIQMEKEWDKIPVNYPNFIFSVSGWIQVVKVKTWTVKPLEVIIVPHSHQDPGWLKTFDNYYMLYTASTLDLIVDKLTIHRDWTFIWSDVIWLARWWSEASADRKLKLNRVLRSGQLEIVTGGWVMSDEATAHYAAMLTQLTEGHQWLQQNLGITPNVSWAVDPFGHSSTMTYLLQRSNLQKMVIQRVSYAVKQHLASEKNLEFYWTQAWDQSHSTAGLCHMMPFLSYAVPFSCGPDPQVCCKMDFTNSKCYYGLQQVPPIRVDDSNVAYWSKELWKQFQKKAELYDHGVLLVPHGDDFYYSDSIDWDKQFGNLTKLINYINTQSHMKTKVRFGTLSDYFTSVNKRMTHDSSLKMPTLAGDFFTYNDRADQYWSGYYTSRPHLKHMARKLQSLLRSVEIFFSLCLAQAIHTGTVERIMEILRDAVKLQSFRQTLSLFQHHDAITGTAKRKVVRDYGDRLKSAFNGLSGSLGSLLANELKTMNNIQHVEVNLASEWTGYDKLVTQKTIVIDGSQNLYQVHIVVYNSLPHRRQDVVVLHVTESMVKVLDRSTHRYISCQVNPVWSTNGALQLDVFELVFEVELPPLSVRTYALISDSDHIPTMAKLSVPLIQITDFRDVDSPGFSLSAVKDVVFTIESPYLLATFATCTGKLQYTTRKSDGQTLRSEVKFMTYGTGSKYNVFKDKSGAYTFQPDGQAEPLQDGSVKVYIVEGPVMSKVLTVQSGIVHTITLYNNSAAVYVDNIVDMSGSQWNNIELVLRLNTAVMDPENKLCVDLNGFQMHKKKTRKKLEIQGNFYPMTSMAVIETSEERLTLLTSSTHGVASLHPGELEVVLDRKLLQGDWRGLNEGVTDNVPTHSQFVLLFERRHKLPIKKDSLMCYPSPMAMILSDTLEQPLDILITGKRSDPAQLVKAGLDLPFPPLPYHTQLVALRSLFMEGGNRSHALLSIHRRVADCGFLCFTKQCHSQSTDFIDLANHSKSIFIDSMEETILTGVKVKQKIKDKRISVPPMEIKAYRITFI
ncbi:alpha-mannosidase 2-like [Ylistrum balloti]|uniref:alpha-mannosidase 2-like n=1 Tax=Ylistrum balloti TaxID=509963 RepID=UPI002905C1CA|nr:alpha-mannosidase 2-like [Ylistrum balloti]